MKRIFKILNLVCAFCVMLSLFSYSFAGSALINQMTASSGEVDMGAVETLGSNVISAMVIAGYLIGGGMVVFIGVKYVLASGDEKADIKNALPKYLVGALLITSAVTIANYIFSLKG